VRTGFASNFNLFINYFRPLSDPSNCDKKKSHTKNVNPSSHPSPTAKRNTIASNEVVVENTVSKLYYLQFITIGISTVLNEHFQLVQFHLKPSNRWTTPYKYETVKGAFFFIALFVIFQINYRILAGRLEDLKRGTMCDSRSTSAINALG